MQPWSISVRTATPGSCAATPAAKSSCCRAARCGRFPQCDRMKGRRTRAPEDGSARTLARTAVLARWQPAAEMKPTHLERRAAMFDLRGRQRRLLRFPSVDFADDHLSVHERPVTARVRSIRGSFEETPLGTDVDGVSGRSALPGSRQRWLNAISGKESSRARLSAGEKLDQDADRRPGVGLELRSESARPGIAATIPPELDAVSDSALLRHARKLDVVVLDVDSEPKLRPAAPHPDDERKIVRVGPRGVSFEDVVGAIHDRLDEVRGRECSVRGRWATVGVN